MHVGGAGGVIAVLLRWCCGEQGLWVLSIVHFGLKSPKGRRSSMPPLTSNVSESASDRKRRLPRMKREAVPYIYRNADTVSLFVDTRFSKASSVHICRCPRHIARPEPAVPPSGCVSHPELKSPGPDRMTQRSAPSEEWSDKHDMNGLAVIGLVVVIRSATASECSSPWFLEDFRMQTVT